MLFEVFVSKNLLVIFPDPPAHSPYHYRGDWYFRLDAAVFAYASRVIPRAIERGAADPDLLILLEDMRYHLSLTDPGALTRAEELLRTPGPIPLPSTEELEHLLHIS